MLPLGFDLPAMFAAGGHWYSGPIFNYMGLRCYPQGLRATDLDQASYSTSGPRKGAGVVEGLGFGVCRRCL